MNWIAAKCPTCEATQALPPLSMLLEAGVGDGDSDTDSTATWICNNCRQLVDVPIDLTELLSLLAAGAPLLATEPDEAADTAEPDDAVATYPEEIVAGPPLTFDDLLDLHESLQRDKILAELLGDAGLCRDCLDQRWSGSARLLQKRKRVSPPGSTPRVTVADRASIR